MANACGVRTRTFSYIIFLCNFIMKTKNAQLTMT